MTDETGANFEELYSDGLDSEVTAEPEPQAEVQSEQEPENTDEKTDEEAAAKLESEAEAKGEDEPSASEDEEKGLPPAAIAAMKDERAKRQATQSENGALQTENEALKAKLAQYEGGDTGTDQPKAPDPIDDPDGFREHIKAETRAEMQAQRFEASEAAFKASHPDYDEKGEAMLKAAAINPKIAQAVINAPDPAAKAYEIGKAILDQKELGDIDAYKARLREEITADVTAAKDAEIKRLTEENEALKLGNSLPQDLSGTPNQPGGRATSVDTGPTEFEDLYKQG